VTAIEPLHDTAYPGDAVVDQMSSDVCYDAALGYAPTAMAADELEVEFFKPTRDTWADNDKTVICLVLSEERFTSVAG